MNNNQRHCIVFRVHRKDETDANQLRKIISDTSEDKNIVVSLHLNLPQEPKENDDGKHMEIMKSHCKLEG